MCTLCLAAAAAASLRSFLIFFQNQALQSLRNRIIIILLLFKIIQLILQRLLKLLLYGTGKISTLHPLQTQNSSLEKPTTTTTNSNSNSIPIQILMAGLHQMQTRMLQQRDSQSMTSLTKSNTHSIRSSSNKIIARRSKRKFNAVNGEIMIVSATQQHHRMRIMIPSPDRRSEPGPISGQSSTLRSNSHIHNNLIRLLVIRKTSLRRDPRRPVIGPERFLI